MTIPTVTALPTAPSRANTPATFNTLADALIASLPTLVMEINAATAAIPAAVSGIDYNGTSVTSVAIGTGSKAFTTQTGKNFYVGQSVRIAYTTTPANYMEGQITAYNSGTGALTVLVATVAGSGTFAAWSISLAVTGAGSYVTLTGAETLTNKTLTTPVLSATGAGTTAGQLGYSGGVMTFGNGTLARTVATTADTQTLTGKTMDTASSNVFKVNGNTLAASAGTATITFPNSTDTLVGRATTDTLTNKTLTAPTVNGGTINSTATVETSGTIAANSVGFRGLPVSANGSLTLALTDAGQHIPTTSNWTIPANASVAFPVGTTIVIVNTGSGTLTLSITTDTLRQSGTANTGSRTLLAYGMATLIKVSSTVWFISGNIS